MKLTTKKLYILIEQTLKEMAKEISYTPDESWGPISLFHYDDDDQHDFVLYRLTNNPSQPFYVIGYLSMGQTFEKCIPTTYAISAIYVERGNADEKSGDPITMGAQKMGYSKVLYGIAFYYANEEKGVGLTSDHLGGTSDQAQKAFWSKIESDPNYVKRKTKDDDLDTFDYKPYKTTNPDDDCEYPDNPPATDHSWKKQNHGEFGMLYDELTNNHKQNVAKEQKNPKTNLTNFEKELFLYASLLSRLSLAS